jgi:hypothetical protein
LLELDPEIVCPGLIVLAVLRRIALVRVHGRVVFCFGSRVFLGLEYLVEVDGRGDIIEGRLVVVSACGRAVATQGATSFKWDALSTTQQSIFEGKRGFLDIRNRRSRCLEIDMLSSTADSSYTTFLNRPMVNTNNIRAAWTKECIG